MTTRASGTINPSPVLAGIEDTTVDGQLRFELEDSVLTVEYDDPALEEEAARRGVEFVSAMGAAYRQHFTWSVEKRVTQRPDGTHDLAVVIGTAQLKLSGQLSMVVIRADGTREPVTPKPLELARRRVACLADHPDLAAIDARLGEYRQTSDSGHLVKAHDLLRAAIGRRLQDADAALAKLVDAPRAYVSDVGASLAAHRHVAQRAPRGGLAIDECARRLHQVLDALIERHCV